MLNTLISNTFFPDWFVIQFLYSFRNTPNPITRNNIPKQTAIIGLLYKAYPSLILEYLFITPINTNSNTPNTS